VPALLQLTEASEGGAAMSMRSTRGFGCLGTASAQTMYHVRPAHSENWIGFTLGIRICCTDHGKCIPPYINLKEVSPIGSLMRNRRCSGTLYTGIYQYRNYVFGTTWYIPVHTSMTRSYSYIPVYPVLYQYSCFHPGGGDYRS
jgi:hypothetical protein